MGQLNQKSKTKQYLPISKEIMGMEWKLIPLKLIKKSFGDELKYNSNLSLNNSYVRHFPCLYKNILLNWKQYLSTDPETTSGILSQNLWFNKHIIIDNFTVNFTKNSQKISIS